MFHSFHGVTFRNIPKFKDRANWSRDTFQPMRRRAFVYRQANKNIAPVIKNFQNRRGKSTCFGPRNSKFVCQSSRLSTIPTFNMMKVNRYDNRGKISTTSEKSVNRKNNRYLFTYLENRPKSRLYIALFKRRNKPQNVLNISRDTSNMASDTLST